MRSEEASFTVILYFNWKCKKQKRCLLQFWSAALEMDVLASPPLMDMNRPRSRTPPSWEHVPEEGWVIQPPQPLLSPSAQPVHKSPRGRIRLREARDLLPGGARRWRYSITGCCSGTPPEHFYFYGKWEAAQCPTNLCHVSRSKSIIKMTEFLSGKRIQRSSTLLWTCGHSCAGGGIKLQCNRPKHPSQCSPLLLGGEASVHNKSTIKANVSCPNYKTCCILERFCCCLQQQQDQTHQVLNPRYIGNRKVTSPNWSCT